MSIREMLEAAQNAPAAGWLQARMKERGWTMAETCRHMGISQSSSLRDVLQGKAKPTAKTLQRLAAAFEVDHAEIAKLYGPRRQVATGIEEVQVSALLRPTVRETPTAKFNMTLEPGGTMRLVLDLPGMSPPDAFKLIDQLRLAGVFGADQPE